MQSKIDKFVFITDPHIANKQPESRTDDYNQAVFKKLEYVFEFCVEKNVKNIILGGDLFHSYKVNPELAVTFVDLVQKYNLQIYYILGNHDIQGANRNYIDKTSLGLLSRYDWFHILNDTVYKFKNTIISGLDFTVEKSCESFYDFPHSDYEKSKYYKILALHAMIVNEPSMIIAGKYRQINKHDIETDADLLLVGHYHHGFESIVRGEYFGHAFSMINPGSIARTDYRQAIEGCGPRLVYIRVFPHKQIIKLLDIPCASKNRVFDIKKLKRVKKTKKELNQFIDALKTLSRINLFQDNLVKGLDDVLSNPPKKLRKFINKETKELCISKLREVLDEQEVN